MPWSAQRYAERSALLHDVWDIMDRALHYNGGNAEKVERRDKKKIFVKAFSHMVNRE